jgi:transposase
MEDVVEYCAGLDVHRDTVLATVRYPEGDRKSSTTRTFGTDTAELVALGDWLVSLAVTRVGLESTGVYWKPVFHLLEERIPQVWLLNATHLKNVPGSETDVADSAWIAQLVEHGLVRPSFVPPPTRRRRPLANPDEAFGRQYRQQVDGAVTDHGDAVAGAQDVREPQQGRHKR